VAIPLQNCSHVMPFVTVTIFISGHDFDIVSQSPGLFKPGRQINSQLNQAHSRIIKFK
jgi:hypothetical protein